MMTGRRGRNFTATTLPNPNSGIDAVALKDGRSLLVYNHTPTGRSPLNIAVSDDGKTWKAARPWRPSPASIRHPAVIHTSDGLVHISYTWKRQRIKHVVIDPAKLELNVQSFGIKCEKEADTIAVGIEGGKTVLSVNSPSGIGGATINCKADHWPEALVLRVYLRGLEWLSIAGGGTTAGRNAEPQRQPKAPASRQ